MDAYEGFGLDPCSLHKYLSCANNPVNAYDSTGHWPVFEKAESVQIWTIYLVSRIAPCLTGVALQVAPAFSRAVVYGVMALGVIAFIDDPEEFTATAASFPGGLAAVAEEYVSVAFRAARSFRASTGWLRLNRSFTGKAVTFTAQVNGGP